MPTLVVAGTTIPYSVRKSARAKRMRITVRPGKVEVVAPRFTRRRKMVAFVESKRRWVYDKTLDVDTMLTSNTPPGSVVCDRAAFAETLYVWALATDGWDRLHYLDARGTPVAFALAEPCPPCDGG